MFACRHIIYPDVLVTEKRGVMWRRVCVRLIDLIVEQHSGTWLPMRKQWKQMTYSPSVVVIIVLKWTSFRDINIAGKEQDWDWLKNKRVCMCVWQGFSYKDHNFVQVRNASRIPEFQMFLLMLQAFPQNKLFWSRLCFTRVVSNESHFHKTLSTIYYIYVCDVITRPLCGDTAW